MYGIKTFESDHYKYHVYLPDRVVKKFSQFKKAQKYYEKYQNHDIENFKLKIENLEIEIKNIHTNIIKYEMKHSIDKIKEYKLKCKIKVDKLNTQISIIKEKIKKIS